MKKSATGLYLSAQPHKSSPRVSGACCSFPSNGLSPATPDAGDLRGEVHGDIHWRKLLLGSVAAGIALFGYGRSSYAACVTSGTTITCTGDMSAGVPAVANPYYTTLNVNSLTTNITPLATDGINFTSTGDITINSDTGDFAISVTGAGANGIYAKSSGAGAGAISITHTGDITSDNGSGIDAYSNSGSVTTKSTGNIQANNRGIRAVSNSASAVSVTHTGDITSDTNQGIFASSGSGSVTTMSTGNIQANNQGIYARSSGAGAVSVTHTGDITSDNVVGFFSDGGIYAFSASGSVTTMSTGNIQANAAGIHAVSNGAGAVSITHTGDITSGNNVGVFARSATGSVATMSTGTIQASSYGIYALSVGGASAVSVTHTGDITSTGDIGIRALSSNGSVTTMSTGNIQANAAGIFARSSGAGAVSITHTGDITSDNNNGITASSLLGATTTHSTGNIQANLGIYAYGGLAVSVTHTGDITSAIDAGIRARSLGGSLVITLADGVVQGAGGALLANSVTGTTLNLNAGSVLIGDITITTTGAGVDVLNTGPGLSIAHTFATTVPTIGNVSGNIAVVSDKRIAVADISGFAAADNQLSIMLDGLSGALGPARHRGDGSVWISAFGGVSKLDGTSMAPKADQSFGGFVVGAHTALGNAIKLGVFGGLSESSQSFDVTNGVETDISSFFGGFYGSYMARMLSLDFAIAAGFTNNDGTRIVANNTVATGLETAQSDHDSFFFAPELTLSTQPINIRDFAFIPSVRVRYELLKSEGFTETGLTNGVGALTMGDSTSHALNVRFQAAFPFDLNNDTTRIVARAGIDARFATHSGWDATLLGVAVNDAGSEDENSAGGFLGLDFIQALSEFAFLTASGELRADTTGYSAIGNFGMKIEF